MSMPKFYRRNVLYFIFAIFLVLIFSRWWSWTYYKNQSSYQDKLELYNLILENDQSETTKQLYDESVLVLQEEYKKQKLRIIIEGVVFFLLLVFGIIRLFIFFRKEIEVADQQSNFLLSITHELKSPLASAILNIQTLQKHKNLNNDKVDQLLLNSEEELSRLRALVERLLLSAKMENQEILENLEVVDLSELYKATFLLYANQYQDKFDLKENVEPSLSVQGDSFLLETILVNLLENAVKYCTPKGNINVGLNADKDWIALTVDNEGEHIPDAEKRKIWNKFYRIGDENTRSSKGTGLGLHIVNEIVQAMKGKVSVYDLEKGVRFKIQLPRIMTVK